MADTESVWHVYRVRNFTRQEVYFGVALEPFDRITEDHANGKTEAIKHWHWTSDDIRWRSLSTHSEQEEASRIAHDLERSPAPQGWLHIQTAGI